MKPWVGILLQFSKLHYDVINIVFFNNNMILSLYFIRSGQDDKCFDNRLKVKSLYNMYTYIIRHRKKYVIITTMLNII